MNRMGGDTWMDKRLEEQQILVRDIATHLAMLLIDWKPLTGEHSRRAKVVRKDSAEIWIRIDGDRIRTSGLYPGNHLPWGTDYAYITTAMSRGAETIARDIQRRFLPKYLPLFERNMRMKAADEEYQCLEEAVKKALCEILGGERVFDKSIQFTGPGGSHGSMTVSGSSVTLELRSLGFEDAKSIARFLVDRRNDGKGSEA